MPKFSETKGSWKWVESDDVKTSRIKSLEGTLRQTDYLMISLKAQLRVLYLRVLLEFESQRQSKNKILHSRHSKPDGRDAWNAFTALMQTYGQGRPTKACLWEKFKNSLQGVVDPDPNRPTLCYTGVAEKDYVYIPRETSV